MLTNAGIQYDNAQQAMKSAEEDLLSAKKYWESALIAVEVAGGHLAWARDQVKCIRWERLQSTSYAESVQRISRQELKLETIAHVIATTTPSFWNPWLSKPLEPKNSPNGLRKKAAEHYGDFVVKEDGEIVTKCWITGIRGDQNVVATAHLMPRNATEHFLSSVDVKDVDDARNMIFFCKNIEQAFNDQKLCFLMDSDTGNLILKILHNNTRDEVVFPGSEETIGLFDGKPMKFMEKEVPFTKVLSLHAQTSYAMAKKRNWIDRDVPDPIMYGSPVSFDTITFTDAVPATDTFSTVTCESQMSDTVESVVA
eukprot:scaffold21696_cov47-Attheya_sp.AAC.1